MPERASIYESVQIGLEGTPGTAVAAKKILAAMSISPSLNPDVKTFKPKGHKFATVAQLVKDWTSCKMDGVGTYTELVYPASSALTQAAITTPGGATLSRLWTFNPSTTAADNPASYSMEFGSNGVRALHAAYGMFDEWGLEFSRKDGVKQSGSVMAQAGLDDKVRWLNISGSPTGGTFTITVGGQTTSGIAYNASAGTVQSALEALSNIAVGDVACTLGALNTNAVRILFKGAFATTAVPAISTTDSLTGGTSPASAVTRMSPGGSQIALVPINAPEIDVYVATSYAGLAGAQKLSRAFKVGWKIGSRFGPIFDLNSSNGAGYAGTVETDPSGELTLRAGATDVVMGFLANLRAGDTLFVRVAATGPEIESGFNYSVQLDTAVKLTKIGDLGDEDGLVAVDYTGEWAHDSTWGQATQLKIQNALTAL